MIQCNLQYYYTNASNTYGGLDYEELNYNMFNVLKKKKEKSSFSNVSVKREVSTYERYKILVFVIVWNPVCVSAWRRVHNQ